MSVGVKVKESSWGVKKSREGLFHVMAVELVALGREAFGWPFGSLGSEQ